MTARELEQRYGPEIDAMTRKELAELLPEHDTLTRRSVLRNGATGLYRLPLLQALYRREVPQQRTLTESVPW